MVIEPKKNIIVNNYDNIRIFIQLPELYFFATKGVKWVED